MNKIVVLLMISTVVMSVISGLLFFQLDAVQNENSKLSEELFDVNSQLEEEENNNLQLEEEILELENQRDELQTFVDEYTNRVNITEFSTYGFNPQVNLLISSNVNVTICNQGINDVRNLVFRIESSEGGWVQNKTSSFNIIRSGEEIKFKSVVYWTLGLNNKIVATVSTGDLILDQIIIFL